MPGERFRRQADTRARGRVGEDDAERWLRAHGYRIVARNVASRDGEIDLVARDGDTLCFVEVKARASGSYGPAVAAVTLAKQRRLARAAARYLARHPTSSPCRFDVLAMDLGAGGWRFSLVRDAFQAPA